MKMFNGRDYYVSGMGLEDVKDTMDTSGRCGVNGMEGPNHPDCTDTEDGAFDFEGGMEDIDIFLMVI